MEFTQNILHYLFGSLTPNLKLTATSLSTTHCYREYAEEIFNTLLVTFYFSLGEVLCNYRHEVEYSSEWVSEEIKFLEYSPKLPLNTCLFKKLDNFCLT